MLPKKGDSQLKSLKFGSLARFLASAYFFYTFKKRNFLVFDREKKHLKGFEMRKMLKKGNPGFQS